MTRKAGQCTSEGQPVRRSYDAAFKLQVVRHALQLPANARNKPIARMYPGLTPVQVRKWIRNVDALENAVPTAKLIPRAKPASKKQPPARKRDAAQLWQSLHQPAAGAENPPLPCQSSHAYPAIAFAPQLFVDVACQPPMQAWVSPERYHDLCASSAMARPAGALPVDAMRFRVLAPVQSPVATPDPTVHDGCGGKHIKAALDLLNLGKAQHVVSV